MTVIGSSARMRRLATVIAAACATLLALFVWVAIRFLTVFAASLQGPLGGKAIILLALLFAPPVAALGIVAVTTYSLLRTELTIDDGRVALRSALRDWSGTTSNFRRVELTHSRLRVWVSRSRVPWTILLDQPSDTALSQLRRSVPADAWVEGVAARRAHVRRMLVMVVIAMLAGIATYLLARLAGLPS